MFIIIYIFRICSAYTQVCLCSDTSNQAEKKQEITFNDSEKNIKM